MKPLSNEDGAYCFDLLYESKILGGRRENECMGDYLQRIFAWVLSNGEGITDESLK